MSESPIEDVDLFRQSDAVEVRRVTNRGKGGRAVFARRDVRQGEVFERVPVLLVPKEQVFGDGDIARRAGVAISWYVFAWIHPEREYVALSLGYGSIYNHSETPNAKYQMHLPDVMEYFALRAIKAGEEITINYRGDDADTKSDLGFKASETVAGVDPSRGR
jgi:SET domain-containing protein